MVGKDGICGIVFEHSASEGITVLRFADQLLGQLSSPSISAAHSTGCNLGTSSTASSAGQDPLRDANQARKPTAGSVAMKKVVPLEWHVDEFTSSAIGDAAKRINKLVTSFFYPRFSKRKAPHSKVYLFGEISSFQSRSPIPQSSICDADHHYLPL